MVPGALNSVNKIPLRSQNTVAIIFWTSSSVTVESRPWPPIPKFSAPFPHTTVTHNIVTVYTTQSTMNLGRALSFCVKKTNHSTYLTAGGSGDGSVHVLSLFTPTLRNENVWGYAYSKNRSYLLLLSVRFDNAFIFTNQSEVDFGMTFIIALGC